MLLMERSKKIEQLVNERGSIRVTELSQLCKVTEETIRKDLDRLESEGKLIRNHGGAISIKAESPDIPYFERETKNKDEKKQIAQAAVQYIHKNDCIALDASTTAWYMAKWIPDIPITVLTNSIMVLMELSKKSNINVISTGGILSPNSLSFVGPLAVSSLNGYHVNKAFISCKGVHLERGISESNEMQALVKQSMALLADEVFVMADHSKFNVQAFALITDWQNIQHVITDQKTDEHFLEQLRNLAIQVIQLR